MLVEREVILVTNIQGCLDLYQRSVIWAMTASATFFLLTLRLGDPTQQPVEILHVELSLWAAWLVALTLFFLLGSFALSAILHAELNLTKLRPPSDIQEAVSLYPSLATSQNGLFRVGSILFCPLAVVVAFAFELRREWAGQSWMDQPWGGILLFCLIIIVIYGEIARRVWRPFGSRPPTQIQA